MFQSLRQPLLALSIALAATSGANAGVVLSGTRVVYPADAREVTLALDNKGKRAALVQAWIDDGDDASTPDTATSPFLMTPPIFRMEAGSSQVLRILNAGNTLPGDRESLFWLNVLDVPPKPQKSDAKNVLQFATRNRIKLFYRPDGLPGHSAAAPATLTWTRTYSDDRILLHVKNTSPYYISFASIDLVHGATRTPRMDNGAAMVAPFSSSSFEFPRTAEDTTKVEFTTINDHGARRDASADLNI